MPKVATEVFLHKLKTFPVGIFAQLFGTGREIITLHKGGSVLAFGQQRFAKLKMLRHKGLFRTQ
jgi:hypothetical protein